MASIGLVGNVIVFSVLFKHFSRSASTTESLLLHQTVVDGLTSLLVIVTAVASPPNSYSRDPSFWEELTCRVWATQLPLWICFSSSCFNLVAITFEQYFSLVHPILHKAHLRKIHFIVPICMVWCCSVVCNVASYIPDTAIVEKFCLAWAIFPNSLSAVFTGIAILLYYLIIPATLMIGCFCHMASVLRKKLNKTAPANATLTFGKARRNILKTLVLFISTFIVLWSYNIWLFFLTFLNILEPSFYTSWKYHLSVLLLFSSCSVNPFIYAVNYTKFQKYFRECVSSWRR